MVLPLTSIRHSNPSTSRLTSIFSSTGYEFSSVTSISRKYISGTSLSEAFAKAQMTLSCFIKSLVPFRFRNCISCRMRTSLVSDVYRVIDGFRGMIFYTSSDIDPRSYLVVNQIDIRAVCVLISQYYISYISYGILVLLSHWSMSRGGFVPKKSRYFPLLAFAIENPIVI